MRTYSALAALAVACALLAGCGGGDRVTPTAYVSSICKAVGPFEQAVVSHSQQLDLTTASGAAQTKQALYTFFSSVAADTDTASAQIKSAGVPDVSNGQQIANAVKGAFVRLDGTMHQAVAQAGALPVSNQTALRNAVEALGNNFRSAMAGIGQNLGSNALRNSDLQHAAATSRACKSVTPG